MKTFDSLCVVNVMDDLASQIGFGIGITILLCYVMCCLSSYFKRLGGLFDPNRNAVSPV